MCNIGRLIYGFANGYFGRDSYNDKRIEAEGVDWIVARGIESGVPEFANFANEGEKNELIKKWSIPDIMES